MQNVVGMSYKAPEIIMRRQICISYVYSCTSIQVDAEKNPRVCLVGTWSRAQPR